MLLNIHICKNGKPGQSKSLVGTRFTNYADRGSKKVLRTQRLGTLFWRLFFLFSTVQHTVLQPKLFRGLRLFKNQSLL